MNGSKHPPYYCWDGMIPLLARLTLEAALGIVPNRLVDFIGLLLDGGALCG